MKGTGGNLPISLIGVVKALEQDLGMDEATALTTTIVVDALPATVDLITREMSREATINDPRELLNKQGRVVTGEAPVLVGIGFHMDGTTVHMGVGKHAIIAGNFGTVFGGRNCDECASNYNSAVSANDITMKPTKSAKGKVWMNFSSTPKKTK